MNPENEPVSDDELASLLETHQGPSHTIRNPNAGTVRFRPSVGLTGAVAAGALLVGSGLGFGVGDWLTPSGNAASPFGLGFVPDSGWRVLQSGTDATRQRPAFAVASNVPLHSEDEARGVLRSSGLPYATLLRLPAGGVVIVATFTVPESFRERYPERRLPLRLRDATPLLQPDGLIRPERPLGEYQLRARVGNRNVDLQFYFGTQEPSRALIAAAQSQLDRLVVQPKRPRAALEQQALPLRPAAASTLVQSQARVIDRTLVCGTGIRGGSRVVDVSAKAAFGTGDRLEWLAQATVVTPGQPVPRRPNYLPTLAAVVAGWPPPRGVTSGAFGFENKLCRTTRSPMRFSKRGLPGGAASPLGDDWTCPAPSTVWIRVRAVFREPAQLRLIDKRFYSAIGRIEKGQVMVRTPNGRSLAYAEVLDSGKARIFTAPSCT